MKKKTKLIAVISAIAILLTGTVLALADQENNIDVPHEHEYHITAFDSETGVVTYTCEICGDAQADCFADHLNESYASLDMNDDGIINGKDFAYLKQGSF